MRELALRIFAACSALVPALAALGGRDLELRTPPEWPFGSMQVPIHPKVAEFYGLQWYDGARRYRMNEAEYTYEEYFAELIRHSIAASERGFTKVAPPQ